MVNIIGMSCWISIIGLLSRDERLPGQGFVITNFIRDHKTHKFGGERLGCGNLPAKTVAFRACSWHERA
jgi:hypothetical protein